MVCLLILGLSALDAGLRCKTAVVIRSYTAVGLQNSGSNQNLGAGWKVDKDMSLYTNSTRVQCELNVP